MSLNSSFSSFSSSTYSSSSSETEVEYSSDKFWGKYRRGRTHKSFWKHVKMILCSKKKINSGPSELYRTQAIEDFYNRIHLHESNKTNIEYNICLSDEYERVFVKDCKIYLGEINSTEKETTRTSQVDTSFITNYSSVMF